MSETGVGIIDHQPVVCESLTAALSAESGLRVLGSASSAHQVVGLIEDRRPDVIILAADFATQRGLDVLEHTRGMTSSPAVVLMLDGRDPKIAARALQMGATGFVLTVSPVRELVDAVRWAAKGQMWASPPILTALLQDPPDHRTAAAKGRLGRLTRRELEVLELLVEGLGHAAISDRLHVSANTVRTHSQNLQKKLEVRSAVAAVSVALEAGLRPTG